MDQLLGLSNQLFKQQRPMLSLYQTLADHFYPERADFTITRNVGSEFADMLVDSYPVIVRRDLGDSFSSMLRDGQWFNLKVEGADHAGTMWLEEATRTQFRHMNYRSAGLKRATKQGDHDFATFGQCALSVELNKKLNGVLIRNWHLRDMAWTEDESGQVGDVSRRWKPTNAELMSTFGKDKVHQKVVEGMREQPYATVDVRHIVISTEVYGRSDFDQYQYVSVFIDSTNGHIIETKPLNTKYYVIPRFQTIAGSPYAYSPATVAGLPDSRCLQAMTHTLLEAGERYARPPVVATMKAVRSDVDLRGDGITWVDNDYDEKLGASLRPVFQNSGGFPIGLEMRSEIKRILSSAFYLDKIVIPPNDHEVTATEFLERIKQYRRQALPLFAPVEDDYNGQLCELVFDTMMGANLFGSPYDIPPSLQGQDVDFKFESPLTASDEERKVNQFRQTAQLLAEAAQFDQGAPAVLNFDEALRDAISGTGSPAFWLNDPEQVAEQRARQQQEQMLQQVAQ